VAFHVRQAGAKGDGEFNTPHGIWIDNRPGRDASVVVCEIVPNGRLQWFTFEGQAPQGRWAASSCPRTSTFVARSCWCLDLKRARPPCWTRTNEVITHLGEDPEWRTQVTKDGNKLRKQPER